MTTVVQNFIAAELAAAERLMDAPVAPFGYGSDLSCADDLSPDMAEVDGFSTLALAQALVRRLDCPRGGLPDDPNYGIDLRSYANRGVTSDDVRALAGAIRSELEKDDRVDGVAVIVMPSTTGQSLAVTLAVTPVDPNLGGFSLTLAVTSATTVIEEMRAA